MMKKYFLTAAICLTLAGTCYATEPATGQDTEPATAVTAISVEQIDVIVDPTPSEDSAPVQESKIAKKMTQAEKAENARINDSWGGAITIIAMCIVISALAILSILFLCFGKISQRLLVRNKRESGKGLQSADAPHDVDSGEVIAAIAAALADHFGETHDLEETILTIRKLKKAYSPWSSKIYNLRQMPDHRRNIPGQASL